MAFALASANIFSMNDFPKDEYIETLRKELKDFQKSVLRNPQRLRALCDFLVVDGSAYSELCKPVSENCKRGAVQEAFYKVVMGMRIDGKEGNWSCGFMGSRWFDLNAEEYDVAHIRCAFYSKKHYEGEWKYSKPYALAITIENTKDYSD
jgi:hypothetical protein